MPAYNFKDYFAVDVATGQKRQTIRKKRKRPTKRGDQLYLYTGMRTPGCRKLRDAVCRDVRYIEIEYGGIRLVDHLMLIDSPQADRFAKADGFFDSRCLIAWFAEVYGLPFKGVVIRW